MLEQLKQIIRAAGQIILSAGAEKDVTEKTGSRDLVTKYDKAVEAFLRARLLALLPEAGFMGEESIHSEDWTRYEWLFIVDPIDGTTNFVQGYANSCVSVGLLHKGLVEYGLVYNPYVDELYWAKRGAGAYLNGERLSCGDRPLERSLLISAAPCTIPTCRRRRSRCSTQPTRGCRTCGASARRRSISAISRRAARACSLRRGCAPGTTPRAA